VALAELVENLERNAGMEDLAAPASENQIDDVFGRTRRALLLIERFLFVAGMDATTAERRRFFEHDRLQAEFVGS
jgi:hypothetical protein